MNSTRIIPLSLLAALFLEMSGFFVLPVIAQGLDPQTSIQTFPVGVAPRSVVFDGANIWVTSAQSYDLTKLRASDGTLVGTFPAGGFTLYGVFDGANIWVTEFSGNTVAQLSARTGAVRHRYAVDSSPVGICFDGTSIWAAGYSTKVDKISKGH